MMDNGYIDSIAAFSKLGIEASNLSRDKKELAKSGTDCLSTLLKLMQKPSAQNITVAGLSFEQIRMLKEYARQCSVEKVVIVPYPNGQNMVSLFRVYGGDIDSFFKYIGCSPLPSDSISELHPAITEFEKEYGIILYENT